MIIKRSTWQVVNYLRYCFIQQDKLNSVQYRNVHTSFTHKNNYNGKNTKETMELSIKGSFEAVRSKDKNTYLDLIHIFVNRDVHRRGHVEFIYSALKNMEHFGVQKDLEVYKALVDVLPKGKFIPTNIFQSEFMHYPKQQQCAIDLLQQMEDNGVMPDYEMEDILMNVFGRRGHPLRKFWRMMYWMPKFKNLSPWPVPHSPPNDTFELAKLAIERISSVDIQAKQSIYHAAELQDSIEDTWIVSSQSPTQKMLLKEHDVKEPVYIEGAFKIWLRNKSVNYFIMRGNPKPVQLDTEDPDDVSKITFPLFNIFPPKSKKLALIPSVHEQEDGVIFAVCATGTSSKDSLLSWVRHLEKDGNPILANVPIVFTLRTMGKEMSISNEDSGKEKISDQ